MPARKVFLYIAMSLDGYIAKGEDNLDFLSMVEQQGEDYGYGEFIPQIDTVIWGRKTYDKVLSFGGVFFHKGKKCYVLSRSRTGRDENVEYYNGTVADLIAELRGQDGKHIYCDGGSQLVFEFLQHRLIDTFIISIIPHLVGDGVRLFRAGLPEQGVRLKKTITFPSGLVQLWYERETEKK